MRMEARGPLKPHPENPRYFADGSGRAVYLSGAHTWSNLKDMGPENPPPIFDYGAYLRFMGERGYNFMRLWTWDLTAFSYSSQLEHAWPFPWKRTGPGKALDGLPRFDLESLDPDYFERLRSRVSAAGARGIYVSVMLFEGHGLHASRPPWRWNGHPFHQCNNINGIDGNPRGEERGLLIHTLKLPEVTAIQEAYVRKVIDTVNDLENVLYEICNEAGAYSTDWQYHFIRYIQSYEATKPSRHPVGMTFQYAGENSGTNRILFDSPADWISPNPEGGYRDDPPDVGGRKVILTDTDHLWGIGGDAAWAWKSFCRGLNPIFMDPYRQLKKVGSTDGEEYVWTSHLSDAHDLEPQWEPVRRALSRTLACARQMDLARCTPQSDLASSRYCLAEPGKSYLIFIPGGGPVEVDLAGAEGEMAVEWADPMTASRLAGGTVPGGSRETFHPPFEGDAVLWITKAGRESQ